MDKIRDLNGPFINSLDNTKYMVIFLHGWGSDGNDLIQLANYWQKDLKNAVFLAPNGPETCNANPLGRQWFDILSEDKSIMYDGIQRACNDLKSYILNNLAKYNLSDNAYFLVGFSQGTMLALHTSLRNKCMGIVGYSGGLVDYKTPSNFELNNTLLLHGKKDTVVPVERMHKAKMILEKLKVKVESVEYDNLEHSINEKGLIAGANFIKRNI